MKVHCIAWKDERWSADKETLKEINKMINKNAVKKQSFFSKLDPQSILLFFIYILAFVYHGSISILKLLFKKLKLNK